MNKYITAALILITTTAQALDVRRVWDGEHFYGCEFSRCDGSMFVVGRIGGHPINYPSTCDAIADVFQSLMDAQGWDCLPTEFVWPEDENPPINKYDSRFNRLDTRQLNALHRKVLNQIIGEAPELEKIISLGGYDKDPESERIVTEVGGLVLSLFKQYDTPGVILWYQANSGLPYDEAMAMIQMATIHAKDKQDAVRQIYNIWAKAPKSITIKIFVDQYIDSIDYWSEINEAHYGGKLSFMSIMRTAAADGAGGGLGGLTGMITGGIIGGIFGSMPGAAAGGELGLEVGAGIGAICASGYTAYLLWE